MEGGERNVYQHHYHRCDYTPPSSSSSLSTAPSDDVSLFLHHLLLRSSPSSMAGTDLSSLSPPLPPSIYRRLRAGKDATFTDPTDQEVLNSVSAAYFSGSAASGGCGVNVPSSSVGASENETDHEYDCESEEGLEALVEEGQAKHAYQRSSSKRTRAAEVHNLSEKRRRSRINEKMKALQNLIPYSNKTDKASMLDEAIEYLKQLQLQVQMLSMRNGMSLHPMCLPGVLQLSQARMGHMNQQTPAQNNLSLPSHSTAPDHPSLPVMSNTETSFGLESHFGSFQLQPSSEEICREVMVAHELANARPSDTIL